MIYPDGIWLSRWKNEYCWRWLTFWQPVQNESSESNDAVACALIGQLKRHLRLKMTSQVVENKMHQPQSSGDFTEMIRFHKLIKILPSTISFFFVMTVGKINNYLQSPLNYNVSIKSTKYFSMTIIFKETLSERLSKKMNCWLRSKASRASVNFWGQSFSRGLFLPI